MAPHRRVEPWAEIDYKSSGGHDQYNGMQLALNRRSNGGVSANVQYTLAKSYGNTGGSNEADTAANNARALEEFDYDNGYNKFDVRHTFNASLLYHIPYGKGRKYGSSASGAAELLLGGWEVGGVVNARSGVPVNVLITRPDILSGHGVGIPFANPPPAASRSSPRRRQLAQHSPDLARASIRSSGLRHTSSNPGVRDSDARSFGNLSALRSTARTSARRT